MASRSEAAAAALLAGFLALATLASCNTEGWPGMTRTMCCRAGTTLVNPCTWFHVTCNNDNAVIRVDLGNAGIAGPLIPDLGRIKYLQYLELYSNRLNGTIPSTLGNLTNLVSLDLYDNRFSGVMPTSLGALSKLRYMRLYENNLTGEIPTSLGSLKSLQELKLQKNFLSGSIPKSLSNVKTLQYLWLSDNKLTGTLPTEILSLVIGGNLAEINIAKNDLMGTVRSSTIRVTRIIQDKLKIA